MSLSENIKLFRKEAGLTQKALASKSGLSFSMVSKLESGEQTNPSFETIKKLAEVLKISPSELLSTPTAIEDQIDEYIEYKRGLNKTGLKTPANDFNDSLEDPCADLNFRKKLYGINHIPKPADHDRGGYSEDMDQRPEVRKLFSILKDATKDEIIEVTRLVEAFRKI